MITEKKQSELHANYHIFAKKFFPICFPNTKANSL